MISSKPIIVANWKASNNIYKESEKKISLLFKILGKDKSKIDLIIAPCFLQLHRLKTAFKKTLNLSAQDVSAFEDGSHTGEITALSVKDSGIDCVMIGHSEKREQGDTSDMIIKKVKNAIKNNFKIILCIGEKERDDNIGYLKIIEDQIISVFNHIDKTKYENIIIAYEPVWAINNKNNISIDSHSLHSMVIYIRKILLEKYGENVSKNTNIIYGGSITSENAQDILWNGEVQGLLIGRASWEVDSLVSIIKNIIINPKKSLLKVYGNKK
jgi:triosephosphate isomerase (TIM)